MQAVMTQQLPAISRLASTLFATSIDDATISAALHAVANRTPHRTHGTAEEFAVLLRQAIVEFNLPYSVELTDSAGFNARPQHAKQIILVSRHIHYEFFSMEGGVRHDLVHILRYLNGKQNSITRSPNYLPTEEGLASFCQDHVRGIVDNGLVQHAAEYLATNIGLHGSLRDIYDYLRSIDMSPSLAWKRAARHKFGFVDTSLPGDIIKPAMYFANEVKVQMLSAEEKLRLFVGKISLDDLPNYHKYSGLYPANQLIDYFNLQSQTL